MYSLGSNSNDIATQYSLPELTSDEVMMNSEDLAFTTGYGPNSDKSHDSILVTKVIKTPEAEAFNRVISNAPIQGIN